MIGPSNYNRLAPYLALVTKKLTSPMIPTLINLKFEIRYNYFSVAKQRGKTYLKLHNNIRYHFTSSSNPTQVSLMQQVQAKVLQIVKKFTMKSFYTDQSQKMGQNIVNKEQSDQLQKQEILQASQTKKKQNENSKRTKKQKSKTNLKSSSTVTQPHHTRINLPNIIPMNKSLQKSTTFQSLGLDSLDTTQLIVTLQQSFGVQLTDEQAMSINTIGMAIDMFFTKTNARIMNKIVEVNQFGANLQTFDQADSTASKPKNKIGIEVGTDEKGFKGYQGHKSLRVDQDKNNLYKP